MSSISLNRTSRRLFYTILLLLGTGFIISQVTPHSTPILCDICPNCCSLTYGNRSPNYRKLNSESNRGDEFEFVKEGDGGGGGIQPSMMAGTHAAGFTTIHNLYVRNGTYFIVTDQKETFPEKRKIIAYIPSKYGLDPSSEDASRRGNEPSDDELQFVTVEEARETIGDRVMRVSGFSVVLDDDQFFGHYYHWWGEIILGFWRSYVSLKPNTVISKLPLPDRFILPYVNELEWRDRAGVDAILMRAAFPHSSIETREYWRDLKELNTMIVFEKAMIVSRPVAHTDSVSAKMGKMIGSTLSLSPPAHFFEPIRQRTLNHILGYIPKLNIQGHVLSPPSQVSHLPIVTYISRQSTGRRLNSNAHRDLVESMKRLEEEGVCVFVVRSMEFLGLREQVEDVAKSTILIGVHGNGLTHQLWMKPSPRSAVFEIMYPRAYVYDYEMLARNMNHKHYAVWNDTLITYPKGKHHHELEWGNSSEFQGPNIPVYGEAIANEIRDILSP